VTTNAGEDVEKLNHSYVTGGNIKWYGHSKKQFGISLKNQTHPNLVNTLKTTELYALKR